MNDFAGTDIAQASMAGPMAPVSAAEITRPERPAAAAAVAMKVPFGSGSAIGPKDIAFLHPARRQRRSALRSCRAR
jgi:hypothetical protein